MSESDQRQSQRQESLSVRTLRRAEGVAWHSALEFAVWICALALNLGIPTSAQASGEVNRRTETTVASAPIYDDQIHYENPLLQLNPACEAHAQFFRVSRPIAPGINHVFVGVKILPQNRAETREGTSCLQHGEVDLRIYGATKGDSDLDYFRSVLAVPQSERLVYVGSAQRELATELLNVAVQQSKIWQVALTSTTYFVSRMVATPLMGRICAKAADELLTTLRPRLQP